MDAIKIRELKELYFESKLLYEAALQIENDIKDLVITLFKFKVSTLNDHINYIDSNMIKDHTRDYLMNEEDFKTYLKETHNRYINHKPTIEYNRVYSYEEYKLYRIAEDLLLNSVHEYMKDNHEEDYPLTDDQFKSCMISIVKKDTFLKLALRLN